MTSSATVLPPVLATGQPGSPPARGPGGRELVIRAVEDGAGLAPHVPAWEDLSAHALEPNVFYEPWMLLPALEAFGGTARFQFVLVFDPNPALPENARLCGFFPLERRRRYRGMPLPVLTLWQHIHCYLCTPLLRAGYARACLEALFDHLSADARGTALVEFQHVGGEGPFAQALLEHCWGRAPAERGGRPLHVSDWSTRPLLRSLGGGDASLRSHLSGSRRRLLKRKEKRLTQTGRPEYVALTAGGDLASWVDQFLRCEAGGWKGREGTALACDPAGTRFFRAVAEEAFRRGRLLLVALHLDQRPVAMRCSFLAGEGSFAFKTAYDENYAAFSPGVLLEVDNICRLHTLPDVRWMDSCTTSDNALLNGLWPDRRVIQTAVAATGRCPGDLAVALLPLMRWVKRKLRWRTRAGP